MFGPMHVLLIGTFVYYVSFIEDFKISGGTPRSISLENECFFFKFKAYIALVKNQIENKTKGAEDKY